MGYFSKETNDGGAIDPVYLELPEGGQIYEIFPTNYTINTPCELLGSPIESAEVWYDQKVIRPTQITFNGIIKLPDGKEAIKRLKKQTTERDLGKMMCKFFSKGSSVANMMLQNVEEVGESNRYDGIEVRISLLECLVQSSNKKK